MAEEVLGAIRTVAAFGGEKKEAKRFFLSLKGFLVKKGKTEEEEPDCVCNLNVTRVLFFVCGCAGTAAVLMEPRWLASRKVS